MNPKARIDSVIYFFLCLSGILTIHFLYFPRECSGYSGIYSFLISAIIFILILAIIIFRNVIGFRKKHRPFDFITMSIFMVFLVTYFITPFWISGKEAGKKIFEAVTSQCNCGDLSTLTLRENNRYEIKMTRTEFACSYTGRYRLRGDTLVLEGNILLKTDSTYFPEYKIDFRDSVLVPLFQYRSAYGSKGNPAIIYYSYLKFMHPDITSSK
jgi:hypothetical protein